MSRLLYLYSFYSAIEEFTLKVPIDSAKSLWIGIFYSFSTDLFKLSALYKTVVSVHPWEFSVPSKLINLPCYCHWIHLEKSTIMTFFTEQNSITNLNVVHIEVKRLELLSNVW